MRNLLSSEELGFFSRIFAESEHPAALISKDVWDSQAALPHTASAQHQVISKLLHQSHFSLHAEIGVYRLVFPLEITLQDDGEFSQSLGIPDIYDMYGQARNWRLNTNTEVDVIVNSVSVKARILSLSSSGIQLQYSSAAIASQLAGQTLIGIQLPDASVVHFEIAVLSVKDTLLTAKIVAQGESREALKRYLFTHWEKYRLAV